MENRKITCVTFPRSGHHLLVNLLLKYFSNDIHTKTYNGYNGLSTISAGSFHYCEYYRHCKRIPCIDKKTNFQKTHDYGLLIDYNPENYYIIQYRHLLESIISYYKFDKRDTVSKTQWEQFALRQIIIWKLWIKKWYKYNMASNILPINFQDIISSPRKVLQKAIEFFNPHLQLDHNLINDIVKSYDITLRNRVEDFDFFDKKFFQFLEDCVSEELKDLEIEPRYAGAGGNESNPYLAKYLYAGRYMFLLGKCRLKTKFNKIKQITLARLKNVAKKLLASTKSSHSRHEDSR